jgi:3-oxoacyl-[acyl-carrier protein] reductase
MDALKRIVITGGTGGLGKAIHHRFLSAGWEVMALGSKDLDLTNDAVVKDFFVQYPCDLLVCAAGMVRDQLLASLQDKDWDEVFELNYISAKRCALAAIPEMNGRGHVIFISSFAAIHPAVGQSAYATSKAALMGLTKDLAEFHGSGGIRVNTILPGFLETKMTQEVTEKRRQIVREMHMIGKFNTPEIIAEFIYFLDEKMPFTSGQIFQLDSRL